MTRSQRGFLLVATPTGSEKLLGNSPVVSESKVSEIFTNPKLCAYALPYRTIKKQNKTPRCGCCSQEAHSLSNDKIKTEVTMIQDRVNEQCKEKQSCLLRVTLFW